MTVNEFPDELQMVPADFIYLERRERENNLEDLDLSLGRIAVISAETWPRSLHFIPVDDGEIMIRSVAIRAGRRVGDCINITVNHTRTEGAFSDRVIDIHDFIIPMSFRSVAYRKTATRRDVNHSWEVRPQTGPILIKRFDRLDERYGSEYVIPAIRRVSKSDKSTMDLIDEAIAAEQLTGWLSLCSQSSYEEYISREI